MTFTTVGQLTNILFAVVLFYSIIWECISDWGYFSDCEGATQRLCFVQYQFDETEHVIFILTHGNRKSGNKPYIRKEKSIIERIKEEPVEAKPRHTFDNISKERGGVLSATSASTLPRDRKQVTYLKSLMKQNKCTNIDLTGKCDPFLVLTVKCKEEEES